jgi:hypothetical protein
MEESLRTMEEYEDLTQFSDIQEAGEKIGKRSVLPGWDVLIKPDQMKYICIQQDTNDSPRLRGCIDVNSNLELTVFVDNMPLKCLQKKVFNSQF